MNIKSYLDSTYLKTAKQANISETENLKIIKNSIQEAISEGFKLIMIRPENVSLAKEMVQKAGSNLTIGTVIDFPDGISSLETKLEEAKKAIANGADDLDFVCNYTAFKKGYRNVVKKEILACTQLGLENNKIVKWIIEVAALSSDEIIRISALIKNVVLTHFKEENYSNVFVKSSTGFYKTTDNSPNGATTDSIIIMLENAFPLSIKASGGIATLKEAQRYLQLGVKRIGTSSAKAIANDEAATTDY